MDEAIKSRIADAKESAKEYYQSMGYRILNSDNETICFTAVDMAGTHERKVRVVVDKITEQDIKLILSLRIPPNGTKEIICRLYNAKSWKNCPKRIYDFLNNLCQ